MSFEPTLRRAILSDAEALAALINSAYRGESSRQGWTTEADLLDGSRTNPDNLKKLMAAEDSVMLLCEIRQQILASVHLHRVEETTRIGMLAVSPAIQGRGIGKHMLGAAEFQASTTWPAIDDGSD